MSVIDLEIRDEIAQSEVRTFQEMSRIVAAVKDIDRRHGSRMSRIERRVKRLEQAAS